MNFEWCLASRECGQKNDEGLEAECTRCKRQDHPQLGRGQLFISSFVRIATLRGACRLSFLQKRMQNEQIYASKIATSIAATPPFMSNKVAPAPLLDFSMNVSVGLGAEAFTVETPPTPPFTSGPPKLPEAAAELAVSGASPFRAGVGPPTLPAMEAGVASGLDVPLPPAPPDAPVLAVPLVDNEALP
jgi:hypothetical protein